LCGTGRTLFHNFSDNSILKVTIKISDEILNTVARSIAYWMLKYTFFID